MKNFNHLLRLAKSAVQKDQNNFKRLFTDHLSKPEGKLELNLSKHTDGFWPKRGNVRQ